MNNEEKTNEAEPKKPGDLTDSIARMTACLEDVIANAKAALDQAQNMNRDGMKWITLSKAVFDVNKRSRLGWQQIIDPASGTGGGAFFTKNEILDFVTANPPLGEVKDAPTPLDPSAPEMVQGGGAKASVPHRKAKFVIEIGGVEFVREVMEGFILYHGAHSTPGGHNPKQWAMEVYRSPSGVVRAVAYNGGDKPVMNISARGNFKVLDRMAVNALGGFVRAAMKPSRIHKSARRTAKAAETAGAPNV